MSTTPLRSGFFMAYGNWTGERRKTAVLFGSICYGKLRRDGGKYSPSRRMNDSLRLNRWNEYDAPHADLREALERFERAGELMRIRGADWNLEMGALAEIVYRRPNPPAILFEDIPGYPKGFRAV